MRYKWRCLFLQSWVLYTMTQVILERCTTCTVLQNIIMVAKDCTTLQIICGGEIKTLFHPTKNRMDKIVIGAAATVGCLQHWQERFHYYQKMIRITMNFCRTLKTWQMR